MRVVDSVPQADHLELHLDPASVLRAQAAQRRRFAAAVSGFDADALAAPTRCSEWSAADVLRHLCAVDRRISAVWAGEAGMAGFDPLRTPNEDVAGLCDTADSEILDLYLQSAESMAAVLESAAPDRWGQPSLSPAGKVPWWLSATHIFWDSWTHERDVLLPVGSPPPVEPDGITVALGWVLGLAGLLRRSEGSVDLRVAGLRLTTGDGPVTVSPAAAGEAAVELEGEAGAVADALSGRGSVTDVLTGDASTIAALGGLAAFFAPSS